MKTALFIGGTTGLGLELATLAVANGWEVAVAGRTASTCSLVAQRRAKGITLDVTAPQGFEAPAHPFDLIVWSVGSYQEGPFVSDATPAKMEDACRVHLMGPASILPALLDQNKQAQRPCHIIIVGSTSAFISRVQESCYGPLQAAKAQLARTLGRELPTAIPGSKITLANPGGMNTPFWKDHKRDVSAFMDPKDVAALLWTEAITQTTPFHEFRLIRDKNRKPRLEQGPDVIS